MATLKISSNNVSNPLTLDLSQYLDVVRDAGMDPLNPQFTQKIWGRSILKEGATLALEQLTEKELLFPLYLGPIGGLASAPVNTSSLKTLEQQINQIINTPGFTVSWQPSGASQPTVFDGLSGQLDIDYDFRREQQFWEHAKLRIFTQPLGRAAGPRVYAAASGVGPLLMISPYASGGALAITASGAAFGASGGRFNPNGASGGISYSGNPSVAGDAPALLQVSYVGPLPNTATTSGVVPYTVVSLLPDQYYQPLIAASAISPFLLPFKFQTGAVASQYVTVGASGGAGQTTGIITFSPLPAASAGIEPTVRWGGQHRVFSIARASQNAGCLALAPGTGIVNSTSATVYPGTDWGLYDLGTFTLRPSEWPQSPLTVLVENGPQVGNPTCALDLTAFVVLPDSTTWFFNPTAIQPSQYGYPIFLGSTIAPYSNTVILDDTLNDQFVYGVASQTSAPSPIGTAPLSGRVTQYTRGLVPRPDPKDGLPIVAILGVGQTSVASAAINQTGFLGNVPGASWANPQNQRTMAQVNVLERTRYTLG